MIWNNYNDTCADFPIFPISKSGYNISNQNNNNDNCNDYDNNDNDNTINLNNNIDNGEYQLKQQQKC